MSTRFRRTCLGALAVMLLAACSPTTYDSTADTKPQQAATTTTLPTGSAAELHANFEHAARTSAADAAAAIVQAIERGQTRLLIGIDARLGDWIFRLVPARASAWFSALARWQRQRLKG